MKYRSFPRDLLRRTTPAQAVIKTKAHATTLVACALIVPSLCAIYFWQAGLKEKEPYWVWASVTLWRVHAVVVAVALFFWLFEKPKLTQYLPVDDDGRALGKMARKDPRIALIAFALGAAWLAWMAILKFEVAHDYWRWGQTGRAIGHGFGALVILILACGAGVGPLLVFVELCRKWFRGDPKA